MPARHCVLHWTLPLLAAPLLACGPYIKPSFKASSYADIPPAEIQTRILLVGDAGHSSARPTLAHLSDRAAQVPTYTTVVFLGDNIYEAGLPADSTHPDYARTLALLDAQIDAVDTSRARGLFVPGNHDWDNSGPRGLDRVQAQAGRIAERLGPEAVLSLDGCPGPRAYDLAGLRLIALDTQWLLHDPVQRTNEGQACGAQTNEAVYARLDRLLQEASARPVVVVGHHPTQTYGHHGYRYHWRHFIFPLTLHRAWGLPVWGWIPIPLIGAIVPLLDAPNKQDLPHPANRAMTDRLKAAFARHPGPLVYAAGHEHNLQVIAGAGGHPDHYALVSGAASKGKITHVARGGDDKILSHRGTGFLEIDRLHDGRLILLVFSTGRQTPLFRLHINSAAAAR